LHDPLTPALSQREREFFNTLLIASLVAEVDGRVVGHIAFSPVTISDGTRNWYGLGPVSVLPEYQRQGIGKALIQEGLARLKSLNAGGVCLVAILIITGNSGSGTYRDLCMRECRRSSSSLCHLTGIFRREPSRFMKHSKRMANKERWRDKHHHITAFKPARRLAARSIHSDQKPPIQEYKPSIGTRTTSPKQKA